MNNFELYVSAISTVLVLALAWKIGFLNWLFTERPVSRWLRRTGVAVGDVLAGIGLRDRKNAAAMAQNIAVGVSMAGLLLGKQLSLTPEMIAFIGFGISAYANMIHPYSVTDPAPPAEPDAVATGPGAAFLLGRK